MAGPLIECVANFSEGRDASTVRAIEDAIVARRIKPFAAIDLFFVLHVVHQALGMALSLERSVHAVFLRNDAGRERGIGDQHDRARTRGA